MCVHSDRLTQRFGSLSQWRAYGGDFALGYDLDACNELWQSETEDWHVSSLVGQVLYDEIPDAQKTYINENQNELVSLIASRWGPQNETEAIELLKNMLSAAAFVKHPGFHEEQEFRFFKMLPLESTRPRRLDSVHHLARQGRLVPYIEGMRGLNQKALKEVIIGPGDIESSTIRSIEIYLKNHGFDDVEIRACPYPLR